MTADLIRENSHNLFSVKKGSWNLEFGIWSANWRMEFGILVLSMPI
jgi:hypothetical protein